MGTKLLTTILLLWTAYPFLLVSSKDAAHPVTIVVCDEGKATIQCPDQEIQIIETFYGRKDDSTCTKQKEMKTDCYTHGVKDKVLQKCFGQQKCELTATTSVFGDNCPGTSKYLIVEYRCQDFPKDLIVCERFQKTLNCPSNQQIVIKKGFYGRNNEFICSSSKDENTRCSAGDAQKKLANLCRGKNTCDVESSSKVFGDPCPGTSKYLQLQYKCVLPKPPQSNHSPSTPPKKLVFICDKEKKTLRCLKAYGGIIEVVKANYGRHDVNKCSSGNGRKSYCKPVDILPIIKSQCDDKNVCDVSAPDVRFGNPCPNTIKYARIVYHCRKVCTSEQFECKSDKTCIDLSKQCDGINDCSDASDESSCPSSSTANPSTLASTSAKTVVICIDDDNTISCGSNSVINIVSATYGRNSMRKCPQGNVGTSSCGPKNIMQEVKRYCNGKYTCKVVPPNTDPCPGTTKYFIVSYNCV